MSARAKATKVAVATEDLPPRPDWLDSRTPWTPDLARMLDRPPWTAAEQYAFDLLWDGIIGRLVESVDSAEGGVR